MLGIALGRSLCGVMLCVIFFFKQKTAYEMRISDWSSDVCSSDLPDLARRFMITMLRITRANVGLRASGRNLAAGFTLNTVGEAVGYFQSRRRHFVSLLYLMADACKGTKKLEPEHAFDVLLPVVEYCCISFPGWNWKGVLADRKSTRLNSSH